MPHTLNGYDLFEVLSALQKSVRRGLEKEALYWAVELDSSGYVSHLWNRLCTICSEDVGLAWPEGPAVIWALREMHEARAAAKSSHRPERLHLLHAVLLLVRHTKSRIVDHALIASYGDHGREEIPDVALDKHTARGKQLGRGWEHFWEEGTRLANEAGLEGETEWKEQARKVTEKTGDVPSGKQVKLF